MVSHLLPLALSYDTSVHTSLGEQNSVVEGPKMCCTLSLSTPIYVQSFLAIRVFFAVSQSFAQNIHTKSSR